MKVNQKSDVTVSKNSQTRRSGETCGNCRRWHADQVSGCDGHANIRSVKLSEKSFLLSLQRISFVFGMQTKQKCHTKWRKAGGKTEPLPQVHTREIVRDAMFRNVVNQGNYYCFFFIWIGILLLLLKTIWTKRVIMNWKTLRLN